MPNHSALRRSLPIALAALLALSAAGCSRGEESAPEPSISVGSETPVEPPTQVLDAASQAMDGLDTIQLVGDLTVRGQRINLEVRTDRHGSCAGRMVQRGGVVNFVATASATYLSGDAAYWKRAEPSDAHRLTRLSNRGWVRFPVLPEFREHCTVADRLLESLTATDGFEPVHTPGFGTQPTRTLLKRDGTTTIRVQVAVDAPHYVMSLVRSTPHGQDAVDFKPDQTTELFAPGPGDIAGTASAAGVPLPHTGY